MSGLAPVRAALETALDGISPALATAWENAAYRPISGTPFQQAFLHRARPDNSEMGSAFTENGIFQVNLNYPLDAGPKDAEARAELIRTTFAVASSFTSGAVTVNITDTPEIAPGRAENDRFVVPVKIRWLARIT